MYKSDPEMRQAVSFVLYEWGMLQDAWERLPEEVRAGKGRAGTGWGYDDDAVIEVFLLHSRLLRDFSRQQRATLSNLAQTNILAEDFFDSGWAPPPLTYLAVEVKTRLDRALHHLAYDRVSYLAQDDWDLKRSWDELLDAREHFLQSLPPQRREWFVRAEAE
jgi:hypothetical protein